MKKKRWLLGLLLVLVLLSGCSGMQKTTFTSLEDLNSPSVKIGVATGSASDFAAREAMPNAEFVDFVAVPDGCAALAAGKIDAFLFDRVNLEYFALNNPGTVIMEEGFGEPARVSVGMALDDTSLCEQINEVLVRLRTDGTLSDMQQRWVRSTEHEMPKLQKPENPQGTLRMMTEGMLEPFNYVGEDGALMGFDVELGMRIAYALGLDIEMQAVNFDALIPSLEAGKCDIIISEINATPERMESVLFSEPYLETEIGIMVAADRYEGGGKGKIKSLSDLNSPSSKIGVATGSASDFAIREALPNATFVDITTLPDGCASVGAEKFDAFAYTKVSLAYYALHDSETTVMDASVGEPIEFCAGLRLEDTQLCERINGALAELSESGTLAEMEQRWLRSTEHAMPELEAPERPEGTLRIMTYGESEPFAYVGAGGELMGFDVELGIRLAYALNMDVKIESVTFPALLPSLQAGKCDMVLSTLNKTPERSEQILFSDPYLTTETGLLVLKERYDKPVTKIVMTKAEVEESLQNASVGAMTGSRGAAFISESYPETQLLQFENTGDAVVALQSGKLDYVICGMATAANFAKANSDGVYVDYPLTEEGLAVAVAKGNTQLQEGISACIQSYRENGVLEDMKKRWYEASGDGYETVDIPVHEDGEVLRVAVTGSQEPVCFVYNNKLTGHDCELMKRIAWDLGMRIEFQDMPISAKVAAIQSGKADAAPSLVPTPERTEAVDFSQVYFDNPQTLLMRKPSETAGEESIGEKIAGFFNSLGKKFTATFITEQRWKLVLNGLAVTLEISVLAFALATVWGGVLLGMERSKVRFLRGFSTVFRKIVSGTPMLVVLMLLYYIVFRGIEISGVLVAILGFGLYHGAGLSEVFQTGIDSVYKGEREAAAALGFKPFAIFKKIVFPQAVNHVFGLYKGQFVALVKATSIVGYIAIQDLTKAGDIIRSRTYDAFFPIIATAVIYFAVTWVLVSLLSLIEVRLDPKKRERTLKGVVCK